MCGRIVQSGSEGRDPEWSTLDVKVWNCRGVIGFTWLLSGEEHNFGGERRVSVRPVPGTVFARLSEEAGPVVPRETGALGR